MATKLTAAYKVAQRKGREAVRNRGKVLWVSCQILNNPLPPFNSIKRKVQGTYVRAIHGKLK